MNPTRSWTYEYCGRSEVQEGARAMHMPAVPPEGWLRITTTKHAWTQPAEGRKRSEEIRTGVADACPACATAVEVFLARLKLKIEATPG